MNELNLEEFDNLYYLCSLIEFISRETNNSSKNIVNKLGVNELLSIYDMADVLHCDSFEETAERYIVKKNIPKGDKDLSILFKKEDIPQHTKVGKSYAYLIESLCSENKDVINILIEVYNSWIADYIEDYESDFYYLPTDYKKCCYEEGKILSY